MKKIVSFILALSMVFSLGVYAFANAEDTINMNIHANDGMMMASHVNDASGPWETNGIGISAKNGESFSDHGYSVTDPVFWDSARKFNGWEVQYEKQFSETDDNGETFTWMEWVKVPESEILTTAEMLAYKKPANYDGIMFRAVWDGNDDDYYTEVGFHNFEGGFTLIHNDLTESHGGFGTILREGYSPKEQNDRFEITNIENPNKYTYEGWICIERETGAVLAAPGEEYHLFTTEEILNEKVPEEEIDYFVKWKELPLSAYIPGQDGPSEDDTNVIFDCYGGYFEIYKNGTEEMESDMFFANIDANKKLSDDGISAGTPIREPANDFVFEGWLEFDIDKEEFVFDADGNPKLWNNADAFGRATPEYKVCYIAKWDEIPFAQYVYGESHETEGYRNIGFYANGGRNEDILINLAGENIGGTSDITQWGLEDNESINDIIRDRGFSYISHVPYLDGVKSESWTLVKADEIMWKEVILGTTYALAANEEILYEEVLGAYQRYLVAANPTIASKNALAEDIKNIADDKSYFAIANWGNETEIEIEGSNEEYKVIEDTLVKVPENLPDDKKDKFDSPEKIEKEIEKEFKEKGHKKSESEIIYMEISLMVKNNEGKFVPASNDVIPAQGIEIIISYPEGIDVTNANEYEFVIAHLKDNGEIELLKPVANSKGLVVKVKSLSPFAILYNPVTGGNGGGAAGTPEPEKEQVIITVDLNKEFEKTEEEANPNTGAPVFLP